MPDQAVAEQTEKTEQTQQHNAQEDSKTQVQSAEFPETSSTGTAGANTSIDILLDMNVPVMVVIGKTELSIQQLLQLSPGSVVELAKPIDAPADLYLKDTKFATGNIVVVEDRFAVRINEILGTAVANVKKNS